MRSCSWSCKMRCCSSIIRCSCDSRRCCAWNSCTSSHISRFTCSCVMSARSTFSNSDVSRGQGAQGSLSRSRTSAARGTRASARWGRSRVQGSWGSFDCEAQGGRWQVRGGARAHRGRGGLAPATRRRPRTRPTPPPPYQHRTTTTSGPPFHQRRQHVMQPAYTTLVRRQGGQGSSEQRRACTPLAAPVSHADQGKLGTCPCHAVSFAGEGGTSAALMRLRGLKVSILHSRSTACTPPPMRPCHALPIARPRRARRLAAAGRSGSRGGAPREDSGGGGMA